MGPAPVSEQFAACIAAEESTIALDEMALLIAAHAHPGLDLAAELARLDNLALGCPDDPDGLARHLVSAHGFGGNVTDYHDPSNSFLDDVLTRHTGIPITLSVLMIAIGQRLGVELIGVGMPGHFIVGTASDDHGRRTYFDLFSDGATRSASDCRRQFESSYPGVEFESRFLQPVGPRAIARRMLTNLEQSYGARDPAHLAWVTALQLAIPGTPPAQRRRLAARLGALGAYDSAAAALDALADESGSEAGGAAVERLRASARAQRARGN
ncbi:MAG TPA: transglutaminase-like domain-containing protein [Acidimicrobiia bacterium]|nr:transglutaminase-like domain-containing protein [Acidimicrobiia bacterium]